MSDDKRLGELLLKLVQSIETFLETYDGGVFGFCEPWDAGSEIWTRNTLAALLPIEAALLVRGRRDLARVIRNHTKMIQDSLEAADKVSNAIYSKYWRRREELKREYEAHFMDFDEIDKKQKEKEPVGSRRDSQGKRIVSEYDCPAAQTVDDAIKQLSILRRDQESATRSVWDEEVDKIELVAKQIRFLAFEFDFSVNVGEAQTQEIQQRRESRARRTETQWAAEIVAVSRRNNDSLPNTWEDLAKLLNCNADHFAVRVSKLPAVNSILNSLNFKPIIDAASPAGGAKHQKSTLTKAARMDRED